jgi:hypothetical protein
MTISTSTDAVEELAERVADRCDSGELAHQLEAAATLRALAAERDALRARAEKAEEWNRQMVEKVADGGTLDGYRELGMKVAAAESRAEAAEAKLERAREALEPFAGVADAIDGMFGRTLFRDGEAAFNEGCSWSIDGETKFLTWGQFRRARAALDEIKGDE